MITVTTLSTQQIKEFFKEYGFEYRFSYQIMHHLNSSMTDWHFLACCFTDYLARRAGVYSFAEVTTVSKPQFRCDRLLLPQGVIIQWEPSVTESLKTKYKDFFPGAREVLVLSYSKYWDELRKRLNGEALDEEKRKKFFTDWATEHRLPWPGKFSYHKFYKKRKEEKKR